MGDSRYLGGRKKQGKVKGQRQRQGLTIDSDTDDEVDTLGLDLVGIMNVTGEVGLVASRGELAKGERRSGFWGQFNGWNSPKGRAMAAAGTAGGETYGTRDGEEDDLLALDDLVNVDRVFSWGVEELHRRQGISNLAFPKIEMR